MHDWELEREFAEQAAATAAAARPAVYAGDLADVERRLLGAIADFDKGHYLPPPNQLRLDIEEVSGRYFQEWLATGPISSPAGPEALATDHLVEMGGEAAARPAVTMEIDLPAGGMTRWRRIESLCSPQLI